eukprot:m.176021 g.176021  ORF g.176021 m.176021 type:complete len:81 (-) comp15434_c0_seq30:1494-1736(-)
MIRTMTRKMCDLMKENDTLLQSPHGLIESDEEQNTLAVPNTLLRVLGMYTIIHLLYDGEWLTDDPTSKKIPPTTSPMNIA